MVCEDFCSTETLVCTQSWAASVKENRTCLAKHLCDLGQVINFSVFSSLSPKWKY
jgi:hypothetical protein